ncbi:MAG: hypothetical protein Q9191_006520 [Dirinaria sp. TL-2023a]
MPKARKAPKFAKASANSPQKAKGITAGRARPAGEVEAPATNSNERDNDDYCAACGGTGQLLCCDNCVRSFHFTCLEPPQDEQHAPEGSWFCRACRAEEQDRKAREDSMDLDSEGESKAYLLDSVMGPLFGKLHGKIERSYALPKVVAEAFEGVRTGETGEYEEIPLPRTRTRSADDALADIAKLKRKVTESVALCFKCGCSNNDLREGDPHNSAVPREIVSCDYCVLSWHLDCLDPPLAINPKTVRPTLDGKKRGPRSRQNTYTWMCPNHAASDDPNLEFRQGVSRTINGKIGKVRRPKHATIRDAGLRRGFQNNGLIEILNDPTEDEEEDDTGVIYRIQERGIKLDFIDRVRQMRAASAKSLTSSDARKLHIASVRRERERAAAKAEREEFRRRSFAEKQVAMTLASLHSGSGSLSPINVGISAVDNLIGTLISEAPPDVQGMYEREEVLSEAQKDTLRKAKEEIERLLARN